METVIRRYNEKCFYDKNSITDLKILMDKSICTEKNGQIIFNVTGIYIINSKVYVIFPCGYNVKDEKKDSLILLDLFTILQKEQKINPNECKKIQINYEGNGRIIPVAYELIKDYRENGYLQIQHIIEGINIGGKINWKKTIKLNRSIFNEEGMPVYTDFINKHSAANQNALLRSLHMYTINMSIALFGFLFGIDSNYNENDIELPVEKNYALHFLKNEKNTTFDTRILKVIDLIIKFLESSEEESNKDTVAGVSTKTFYAVWEFMCKTVFKDEYNKYSVDIPKPYWKDYKEDISYTEQIPDIIYKQDKTLYILDAKYYNIKKNKPGWHDLVKQFFYEMSLKQVMEDVGFTYNVMIIPGNIDEKIKYWAYSEVENVPLFGQVLGIQLDMKTVISDFSYGCRNDYRRLLDKCLKSTRSNKNI